MKKNKSKTVVVKVTALDIKNGIMEDDELCPVAIALKRYKNELRRCAMLTEVSVGILGIELSFSESASIKFPAPARKFIERFDGGLPVKPFSFRIRL